jgi:hypothetical protein
LATQELVKLADSFGVDIPPELDRPFIIEELLEAAEEEDEKPLEEARATTRRFSEKRISEPVPIPAQYNITFIEVLRRDPLWAFAFWEVKGTDKELYERDPAFEGYQLNVVPEDAGADTFVISVGIHDDAWYIGFPPEGRPAGRSDSVRFTVELRATLRVTPHTTEKVTLAISEPFSMPRLSNPAVDAALYENPLTQLSGLADFTILRNIDRESPLTRG